MSDQPLIKVEAPPVPALPDPGQMLKAFIERGITAENVSAATKLMELYEHVQDRDAAREFAAAFVELQKEIPKVQATVPVPAKDGSTKYKYAPFEHIDAQLRPLALKFGFTYTFAEGADKPGKICTTCIITHTAGHTRRNDYTVRVGSGPYGASESQADSAAHTTSKRGALCDAFSIVVAHLEEMDANLEGGTITAEQAGYLKKWVADLKANEVAFLKFAGAATYEAIPAGKLQILEDFLAKKERLKKVGAK
jgi:hypothetical protein